MPKWEQLAHALVAHARVNEVTKVAETNFGTRYVVEGKLQTPVERQPNVRVVWFVSKDTSIPRLVTAYPLEGGTE